MKAYVVESILGILALDEQGAILAVKRFDGEAPEIAEKLAELERGRIIDELTSLINELKGKGFTEIVVEDEELGRNLAAWDKTLHIQVKPGNNVVLLFRSKIDNYLSKIGVTEEKYRDLFHQIALELTKMKVREAAEKRDLFIAQAISAMDEVTKTINLFASRVREWYGLHFPEMDDIVRDHKDYVRLVYEIGERSNYTKENLKDYDLPEEVLTKLVNAAKTSMGANITEFDLQAMKNLAKITLDLYDLRTSLQEYIDEAMKEVAPNIRGLVGPLLGARLIALAGGLSKLAILPASTIQVLGAEKALFRALRTGGKPPKHGVIFQHPEIHRAPRWQRGKIARALAAKLAIAARIDAFTGEYKAEELKEELEKRIKEIKTLYAKPPVRKTPPSKPKRRKKKRKKGRR
ncbi:MAG: C/D box methylation guide ribonucleoprotein complex aNOP56 subunit [Thermoprotei archaeon]|nr:MAG: C/D box methylation guide ribonucleoprotein complex aNOP56 subunit [Thermoprotei archaeon]